MTDQQQAVTRFYIFRESPGIPSPVNPYVYCAYKTEDRKGYICLGWTQEECRETAVLKLNNDEPLLVEIVEKGHG